MRQQEMTQFPENLSAADQAELLSYLQKLNPITCHEKAS